MTSELPSRPATRDATYFDQWYADMAASPARDAIVARTLGLPPELHSSSHLSWQGIADVTEELRLPPDSLLVEPSSSSGRCSTPACQRVRPTG